MIDPGMKKILEEGLWPLGIQTYESCSGHLPGEVMSNGRQAPQSGAFPYIEFKADLLSPSRDVWETSMRWGAWLMFTWESYRMPTLQFIFHNEGQFGVRGPLPSVQSLDIFHTFLWGAVERTRKALYIKT